MEYGQDIERAAQLARTAQVMMEDQGIPANPNNYAIWYHYFADSYPDLKRTLKELLDNQQEFTTEQCEKLYERYFGYEVEGSILREASAKLEQTMAKAVAHLGTASSDAAQMGASVKGAVGGLSAESSQADLQKVVEDVIQVTARMEARTRELELRLAESSAEVDQLREEVKTTRREAGTDSLTGIGNRKTFDGCLRQEAINAMETGEELSLLLADIDFFKKFNDEYGHQIGDQVLKLLANTLTENIKGSDIAARYGGEEFAVILPRTALQPAFSVAENIRQKLAKKSILNKRTGQHLGSITLSIGVAQFEFGESLTGLISRADEALYAAKHQGRNKVVIAGPSDSAKNFALA